MLSCAQRAHDVRPECVDDRAWRTHADLAVRRCPVSPPRGDRRLRAPALLLVHTCSHGMAGRRGHRRSPETIAATTNGLQRAQAMPKSAGQRALPSPRRSAAMLTQTLQLCRWSCPRCDVLAGNCDTCRSRSDTCAGCHARERMSHRDMQRRAARPPGSISLCLQRCAEWCFAPRSGWHVDCDQGRGQHRRDAYGLRPRRAGG